MALVHNPLYLPGQGGGEDDETSYECVGYIETMDCLAATGALPGAAAPAYTVPLETNPLYESSSDGATNLPLPGKKVRSDSAIVILCGT